MRLQADERSNSKHRGWIFTFNNPPPEAREFLLSYSCRYICFQLEKGENGTPHFQGVIYFQNQVRFSTLKKSLQPYNPWLKPTIDWDAAHDYCRKSESRVDGPWFNGEPPKQGTRSDLVSLKDQLINGETSVDQIIVNQPEIYHQYGRTLSKLEDIALRKRYRTTMPECIWYWGPTGVGKSHAAFEGYHPDTHYRWKNDNGWQDGYTGQPIIIINDFRGSIKYDEMLQLCDKWPYDLPRRGREPAPCLATKIIVTSSLPPHEVYCNRNANDSIDQLMRRFTVVHLTSNQCGAAPSQKEPQSPPPLPDRGGVTVAWPHPDSQAGSEV